MPRVGGQPVHVPDFQGVLDFVGEGAVEEELHTHLYSHTTSFTNRFLNSTGSPWCCSPIGPVAGTPGRRAPSITVSPLRTTVTRSPRIVISKWFHSPNG